MKNLIFKVRNKFPQLFPRKTSNSLSSPNVVSLVTNLRLFILLIFEINVFCYGNRLRFCYWLRFFFSLIQRIRKFWEFYLNIFILCNYICLFKYNNLILKSIYLFYFSPLTTVKFDWDTILGNFDLNINESNNFQICLFIISV